MSVGRIRLLCGLALAAMLLAASAPVYAQTPTPEPWPTPIVTTEYIIRQEVTYGEGGIIVMLFFMAGVLLLQVLLHLGERVTDR